ncbi:DUF2189 domain-containing protein [Dechloromonas sp. ARDL1]|uniref:DUF2189 domain-containing protein n=1 Tax=Dechloromonas sp. ARDL1 TaxID=3322121 RepID=UPI003DA74376
MTAQPLTLDTLFDALAEGWRLAGETKGTSIAYTAIFVLVGAGIIGGLLVRGWTPFVIAAAGAFMLVGPAILAGFFGIARDHEAGGCVRFSSVAAGFSGASRAIWALALVCGLLFMIFVTDAAILYAYMIGDVPVWLGELLPASASVSRFVLWSSVSGAVVAFLLFTISAFAVPLLCERRAGLVEAVVTSVRVVFGNFFIAMVWAVLLSATVIGSILALPLLLLTLPWLAYASRALYRAALPV